MSDKVGLPSSSLELVPGKSVMTTGCSSYNTALNGDASLRLVAGHNGPGASILQLPTELVVQIFQFALPATDFMLDRLEARLLCYMQTLYTIRPIAKRWQKIVDGAPTLWKIVMSTLPPHVNEATISRSRNGPLTVMYPVKTSNIGHDQPSAQDFVDSLAHTFPRWSAYSGPLVSGYFHLPAPHLQEIFLWHIETYGAAFELFGGSKTNLRHVDLYRILIRWKTGLFAQLKVLKLKGPLLEESKFTTICLLDTMCASPSLEHLELSSMFTTPDHAPSSPVITLPRLRYISFHYCHYNFTGAILNQIRAPSCTEFYLSIYANIHEQNLPIFWGENLGLCRELLHAIHTRNGFSEITPDNAGLRWESAAEDGEHLPTFSVFISSQTIIPWISWVEHILQGNPGLGIYFRFEPRVDLEVLLESIKPMRCVTRVEIGDFYNVDKCLVVLKFIGEPQNTDPPLPSLPCLQELLLTGPEWNTQSVLDMVRSRFNPSLWGCAERTPLTISMSRAFDLGQLIRPIPDLPALSRIREIDRVECVRFVGSKKLDDTDLKYSYPSSIRHQKKNSERSRTKVDLPSAHLALVPGTSVMETGYFAYNTALNGDTVLLGLAGQNGPVPSTFQLPTELVVKIFEFTVPSADFTLDEVEAELLSYMRTLYTIRLTAKRWQEIVDGSPNLWQFVMPTLPPHVNEATISRSGDGPLTVMYTTKTSGIGHDHPSAQDFVDSLAHTFPRWSAYRGPVVSGYFDKPAPQLQAIVLWPGETHVEALDLLGGCATNLRHVDLSRTSIRWKTGLFAQLKVLKLRGAREFTTTHFLDALRASPGLEHLDLDYPRATIDHAPSSPVITLPQLRHIDFDACDRRFAEAILPQIRAPSCTDFCLFIIPMRHDEEIFPMFWNKDLGAFDDSLRAIHSRNESSKITLDGELFVWKSPAEDVWRPSSFSIFIPRHGTIPANFIFWIERILQEDPGLCIRFSYSPNVAREVLDSIKRMRCITRVEMEDFYDGEKCLVVLKLLGEPLGTDLALPSFPCLQELLLDSGEWTTQNVLDMVRSRFSSALWEENTERTPLTISMSRGAFTANGAPRPISDLNALARIRETDGVECVRFVGSEELDGTLAITWDEKTSAPAWGTSETERFPALL